MRRAVLGFKVVSLAGGAHFLSTVRRPTLNDIGKRQVVSSTYPANEPNEDRIISFKDVTNKVEVLGVLDGHGGPDVAEFVATNFPAVFDKYIDSILRSESEVDIDQQLVLLFQTLEDMYLNTVRPLYNQGVGSVASVGCCTLIALSHKNTLTIANCGDCRAVLGSEVSSNGNMAAIRLTREHNARCTLEQLKLKREHPGEVDVFRCKSSHACYVKVFFFLII